MNISLDDQIKERNKRSISCFYNSTPFELLLCDTHVIRLVYHAHTCDKRSSQAAFFFLFFLYFYYLWWTEYLQTNPIKSITKKIDISLTYFFNNFRKIFFTCQMNCDFSSRCFHRVPTWTRRLRSNRSAILEKKRKYETARLRSLYYSIDWW
jgi:hypothetical protein